jgi:hypothetical protein
MPEYLATFLIWFWTILATVGAATYLLLAFVPGCTIVNAIALLASVMACTMYYVKVGSTPS